MAPGLERSHSAVSTNCDLTSQISPNNGNVFLSFLNFIYLDILDRAVMIHLLFPVSVIIFSLIIDN